MSTAEVCGLIVVAWALGWTTASTWSLRARRIEWESVSVGATRDGRVSIEFGQLGFRLLLGTVDSIKIGSGLVRVGRWVELKRKDAT